jgi:hypothetical protein
MLSSAHGEQSAPIFTKIIVHPAYGCFVSTARCPRAGRRLQPLGKVRVPESQKPRLSGLIFAVIICAALGGCAQDFDFEGDYGAKPVSNSPTPKRTARTKPKIDNALLETPGAPDCGTPQTAKRPAQPESATASAELTTQSLPDGATQDANADLATRIKLEYERECYRQAEARVRDRLKQLQASTNQTAKAAKGAVP